MPDEIVTARMIMERMPEAFLPEKARGVNVVVQYILTGEGGGDWHMTVANDTCQIAEGQAQNAATTITMSAQDYVDLTTGKLNAVQAFMMGRLKIDGDFSLATRITSFFGRG